MLYPFAVLSVFLWISGEFTVLKKDENGVNQVVFVYTAEGSAFGGSNCNKLFNISVLVCSLSAIRT